MLIGQTESFARGIDKFVTGLSVRLVRTGDLRNPFADERMRDDELRFSVVALFGDVEGIEKLLHVLAVDQLNIPAISREAFAGVFALCLFRRRVEGDRVGIVNHDQIIETEMPGERARLDRKSV